MTHIWVPRARILEASASILTRSRGGGEIRLSILKRGIQGDVIESSRRYLTDWFDNIVVNSGLDLMGQPFSGVSAGQFRGCHVGSGNATPVATQTSLQSYIAGVAGGSSQIPGSGGYEFNSGEPYVFRVQRYRFPEGTAAGNIAEIGITSGSTDSNAAGNTNFTLFARALVVDNNGNPTVVTVLGDEILDVEYRYRHYIPTGDVTGTITLKGSNYQFVVRAASANATNFNEWLFNKSTTGTFNGWDGDFASPGNTSNTRNFNMGFWEGGSSSIGSTINDSPTGNRINAGANGVTLSQSAYISGSYQRTGTYSLPLGAGNSGIGAMAFGNGLVRYQAGFTPRIAKTSDDILSINFSHSWGRR